MTPERWQQVKEIFNSAINYRPDERSVFLSKTCLEDEELRNEVESLIRSYEKSGEFIDAPAFKEAAELFGDEKSELSRGRRLPRLKSSPSSAGEGWVKSTWPRTGG